MKVEKKIFRKAMHFESSKAATPTSSAMNCKPQAQKNSSIIQCLFADHAEDDASEHLSNTLYPEDCSMYCSTKHFHRGTSPRFSTWVLNRYFHGPQCVTDPVLIFNLFALLFLSSFLESLSCQRKNVDSAGLHSLNY